MNANDYFQQKEAEYQAAVAKQEAERRAEGQKERAKIKAESDKIYTALVDTFPKPETAPAPTRSFRDAVRDAGDGITKEQRDRWYAEDFHARRAAAIDQEMKQLRRGQSDELGVNGMLGTEIDLDDAEYDDDDEYQDDED